MESLALVVSGLTDLHAIDRRSNIRVGYSGATNALSMILNKTDKV